VPWDRARKRSVRARMAAGGVPDSVAAAEAAQDEVSIRVRATLAEASARLEARKETRVSLALLRTTFSESALGVIEPSARRFQYIVFKQHNSSLAQMLLGLHVDPVLDTGPVYDLYSAGLGEGPLELLIRLQSVTAARYAGEEMVRGARCRKIAVTVGGIADTLTIWVDRKHVRQIQAVTPTVKPVAVVLAATTTVTVQLWDFGVPVDSMDWDRPGPSALWSK